MLMHALFPHLHLKNFADSYPTKTHVPANLNIKFTTFFEHESNSFQCYHADCRQFSGDYSLAKSQNAKVEGIFPTIFHK